MDFGGLEPSGIASSPVARSIATVAYLTERDEAITVTIVLDGPLSRTASSPNQASIQITRGERSPSCLALASV